MPAGRVGGQAAPGACAIVGRMTKTTRDVQKWCPPFLFARTTAPLLSLATAALAALAVGCGQEGKSVETVLPVQGLAYDAPNVAIVSNTLGDTLVAIMNVKFKVQTTYANGCEARGGLQILTEGPEQAPLFVISPVSRYTADMDCNIGLAGDTLQTIQVNGVRVGIPVIRDNQGRAITDSVARFEVRGHNAPPIRFNVNLGLASRGDTATAYYVKVEDKDTASPLTGAIVRVERYGTPDVLGEGATGADGSFAFNVACSDTAGRTADPYVVKVSYASRITILTVNTAPALCKRREQIIVRV